MSFLIQKAGYVFILLFVFSHSLMGDPLLSHAPEGFKLTLALPVYEIDQSSVLVKVPESFQNIEDNKTDSLIFLEFISKKESPDEWSAILTLSSFLGLSMSSTTFIDELHTRISGSPGSEATLLAQNSSSQGTIETAEIALSYFHHHRREVVKSICFSGPYDCSCVQYAVAVSPQETEAQALQKIESFLAKTVELRIPQGSK